MSSTTSVEIEDRNGVVVVVLSGVIDEDNQLSLVTERITAGPVLIDTKNIDRINSCGVRDWVNWLGTLEDKGCDIYLVGCSTAMVTQVNLVNNFISEGKILSFYAPYYCEKCDVEKAKLLDVRDLPAEDPRAPAYRCEDCDRVLEFDDIERSYFHFLQKARSIEIDERIAEAVAQIHRAGRPQPNTPDSEASQSQRSKSRRTTLLVVGGLLLITIIVLLVIGLAGYLVVVPDR